MASTSTSPTAADPATAVPTMRSCARRLLCCWSPRRTVSVAEYWCSIGVLVLWQFLLWVLVARFELWILAMDPSLRTRTLVGEEALLVACVVKLLIWRYRDAGVSLWWLFGQCVALAASVAAAAAAGFALMMMALASLFGATTSGGGGFLAVLVVGGFASVAVLISIGVTAQLPTADTERRHRRHDHRLVRTHRQEPGRGADDVGGTPGPLGGESR